MSDTVRVSILSRNELVREGLRRILIDQGFLVDQTCSVVSDLRLRPDDAGLIVVDATVFAEGLAACEDIRQRCREARIVLMVDEYAIDHVAAAFSSGAVDGYLLKAISCEPLAGALRLIAMGEKLLPSQIAETLTSPLARPMPRSWDISCNALNLSSREVEILRCLVDGDSNKMISRRLSIADSTVKVHVKAILRKLRMRNRTQAAIWAVNRGLTVEQARPVVPAALSMRTEELRQVAKSH